MAKYYTVTTPDTGKDGKTRFHKAGVAFPQNAGAKSFLMIQLFIMLHNIDYRCDRCVTAKHKSHP